MASALLKLSRHRCGRSGLCRRRRAERHLGVELSDEGFVRMVFDDIVTHAIMEKRLDTDEAVVGFLEPEVI